MNVLVVVVAVVVSLPTFARAQSTAEIDAVAVSPNHYKILLENEHVRVVEYTLQPGERDNWHTHPPKTSYVVNGGTFRIHFSDGSSVVSEAKKGTAVWADTVPRHYAEN